MKIEECKENMPVKLNNFITLINKVGKKKIRVTNTLPDRWQNSKSNSNWIDPQMVEKV